MPPRPSRKLRKPFKKADVKRAMEAVRAAGLTVASVEIGPDGTIRLSAAEALAPKPTNEFEAWENRL